MSQILDHLMTVAKDPYQAALEEKKVSGRRLVGYAPMRFPEELIHAAGAQPLLLQESDELISTGYAFIHPNFCGLVRSLIDLGVKSKLNFFDALLIPNTCLQMWAAANLLRKNLPEVKIDFIQLPTELEKEDALKETVEKFKYCISIIEDLTGKKISSEQIISSIQIYNQHRQLMSRLYDLRGKQPGIISAVEIRNVVQSSMVMPKEAHNQLLEKLLLELKNRERPEKKVTREKVRIFLSGNLCQAPKPDILWLIEDLGGTIVDDDLYTGRRYFSGEVKLNGDPVEALAKRFVQMTIPCPTKASPQNTYGQYLINAARESKARGIIVLLVKYCEPHMFYYPDVSKALDKAGIPHILIETEHESVSLEGIRTRIQAFMEMI